RSSNTVTMPPTLPDPEALDQMMLGSTGSGVAKPLSPPVTGCQAPRGIVLPRPPPSTAGGPGAPSSLANPPRPPPARLLLGPRYELPSCLLPRTKYGI